MTVPAESRDILDIAREKALEQGICLLYTSDAADE